jgi:hypothetical protein
MAHARDSGVLDTIKHGETSDPVHSLAGIAGKWDGKVANSANFRDF